MAIILMSGRHLYSTIHTIQGVSQSYNKIYLTGRTMKALKDAIFT